jgi:hypothetical protein
MDLIAAGLLLPAVCMGACSSRSEGEGPPCPAAAGECRLPDVFPYAPLSTYRGIHGNRENNDRILYTGPESAELGEWHALKGKRVWQPISFSADSAKIYATTLNAPGEEDPCNFFEVTLATGAVRCLGEFNTFVAANTVPVDAQGDFYLLEPGDDPADGEGPLFLIRRFDAEGTLLRTMEVPGHAMATGAHFTPDGHLAMLTVDGTVVVAGRGDDDFVRTLDLVEILDLRPPGQAAAPASAVSAVAGASSVFSFETIGVSAQNQLFPLVYADDGAVLAAVDIDTDGSLELAWTVKLAGQTSSTSPAVTFDGNYVAVGDDHALVYLVDVKACNRNRDGDPDPRKCEPLWSYPLAERPSVASIALDENACMYLANWTGDPAVDDLFVLCDNNGTPEVKWGANLSCGEENATWTSSTTVLDNYVLGGITWAENILPDQGLIPIGKDMHHEIVALDIDTGEVVWRAPARDDSINAIAYGPDGNIYVPNWGFLDEIGDRIYPGDTPEFTGGITRYEPVRVPGQVK